MKERDGHFLQESEGVCFIFAGLGRGTRNYIKNDVFLASLTE